MLVYEAGPGIGVGRLYQNHCQIFSQAPASHRSIMLSMPSSMLCLLPALLRPRWQARPAIPAEGAFWRVASCFIYLPAPSVPVGSPPMAQLMQSDSAVPSCQHSTETKLYVQWVDQKEVWDKQRVMQGIVKEPEPPAEPPAPAPAPEQPGEDAAAGASGGAQQDAGDAGLQQSDEGMQVGPHLSGLTLMGS